jgi:hypothetical protein
MKTRERDLARRLRREDGAAINEIASRLRVSKSSVSLWVRDIELTPAQQKALLDRNPAYNRQYSGSTTTSSRRTSHFAAMRSALRVISTPTSDGWLD